MSQSRRPGQRFASLALVEEAGALARALRLPSERLHDLRNAAITALATPDLWLTAEEARALTAALAAVLDPYRGRALADRPDGSRRVRVMNMVSPHRRA